MLHDSVKLDLFLHQNRGEYSLPTLCTFTPTFNLTNKPKQQATQYTNSTLNLEQDVGHEQRYCATTALQYPDARRVLFTHLSYDVRCLIYDLFDLPPISHACLGLVISCKEGYAETSVAAARHLDKYLKDKETAAKRDGFRLVVPKLSLDASFASLQNITIQSSGETVLDDHHGLP
jgi:hypothetical protein